MTSVRNHNQQRCWSVRHRRPVRSAHPPAPEPEELDDSGARQQLSRGAAPARRRDHRHPRPAGRSRRVGCPADLLLPRQHRGGAPGRARHPGDVELIASPTNPWRWRWLRGMRGPLAARPSPTSTPMSGWRTASRTCRLSQLSHAPVVVLNGLKAATLARAGWRSLRWPTPRDMVRQHVKWSHVCATLPTRVADDVDHALHIAVPSQPARYGSAVPQDLLEADVTGTPPGTRRGVRASGH